MKLRNRGNRRGNRLVRRIAGECANHIEGLEGRSYLAVTAGFVPAAGAPGGFWGGAEKPNGLGPPAARENLGERHPAWQGRGGLPLWRRRGRCAYRRHG